MASVGATGRFRRTDRLLDSRDFRRVMRSGTRRAHRDLVVFATKDRVIPSYPGGLGVVGAESSRIGITASRKVGNAVVRNRFKRCVRDWFRTHRDELPPGLDLLVIARRSGARLDSATLDQRLRHLLDLEPRVG